MTRMMRWDRIVVCVFITIKLCASWETQRQLVVFIIRTLISSKHCTPIQWTKVAKTNYDIHWSWFAGWIALSIPWRTGARLKLNRKQFKQKSNVYAHRSGLSNKFRKRTVWLHGPGVDGDGQPTIRFRLMAALHVTLPYCIMLVWLCCVTASEYSDVPCAGFWLVNKYDTCSSKWSM